MKSVADQQSGKGKSYEFFKASRQAETIHGGLHSKVGGIYFYPMKSE